MVNPYHPIIVLILAATLVAACASVPTSTSPPTPTEAGDIILYQGSAIVIYYASNSWNLTRLGKVNNVTAAELKDILGDGKVTITLSLPGEF